MRILGIDYGEARVGIAVTDPLNITAQGLETIQRNGSDKVILRRLDEIFETYEVDTIVVGMPLNMNGTMSERAKITELRLPNSTSTTVLKWFLLELFLA